MCGIKTWTQFFTQPHFLFRQVDDEVGKRIHLPGIHICAAQTRVAYYFLI